MTSDGEPSAAGVINDVEGLCDVFTDVFGVDFLAGQDKDVVMEAARQSLQDAHLHRDYDFGDAKDTQQTVICEHTSQFTGCRFWIDEDNSEKMVFISETDAAAYEYQKRGFTEYGKNAISNISLIPQKTRRTGSEVNVRDRPPPIDLKIPAKLPKLSADTTKIAAQVVEEFETKVVDADADEVYSPLRLWTQEARRGITVPSTFCTRLNQYYAIKVIHKDVDPKDLNVTATNLKKEAREAMANAPARQDKSDFWYVTCVDVYNNSHTIAEE